MDICRIFSQVYYTSCANVMWCSVCDSESFSIVTLLPVWPSDIYTHGLWSFVFKLRDILVCITSGGDSVTNELDRPISILSLALVYEKNVQFSTHLEKKFLSIVFWLYWIDARSLDRIGQWFQCRLRIIQLSWNEKISFWIFHGGEIDR